MTKTKWCVIQKSKTKSEFADLDLQQEVTNWCTFLNKLKQTP